MVEMENGGCFVYVEVRVVEEWKVLGFSTKNLSNFVDPEVCQQLSNTFRMVVGTVQCLFSSFQNLMVAACVVALNITFQTEGF